MGFLLTFFLTTASLRRNVHLKKDRHTSSSEPRTPDAHQADFLIYEEVTQYLPRPGDRPRLIVLIGMFNLVFGSTEVDITLSWVKKLCRTIWGFQEIFHQNAISLLRYVIICWQAPWELGSVSLNRRWSQKIHKDLDWLSPVSIHLYSHLSAT